MNRLGIVPVALLLVGFSPFMAEHPRVEKGNRALSSGDAEAALKEYNQALTELGSRPEIEYNRGNALYRLKRFQEAREAYEKALAGPESLQARDYFNMGNALAQLGSADDALKAYRRALALDQKNEDARYNLEVLLRRQKEEQRKKDEEQKKKKSVGAGLKPAPSQKDEKQAEGEQQNKDQQQRKDQKQSEGDEKQQKNEKKQDPGKPEGERDEKAAAARDGEKQDGDAESRGGQKRPELSRQDAERLLDAMRAREQNMPVARSKPGELRSNRVEKDW